MNKLFPIVIIFMMISTYFVFQKVESESVHFRSGEIVNKFKEKIPYGTIEYILVLKRCNSTNQCSTSSFIIDEYFYNNVSIGDYALSLPKEFEPYTEDSKAYTKNIDWRKP